MFSIKLRNKIFLSFSFLLFFLLLLVAVNYLLTSKSLELRKIAVDESAESTLIMELEKDHLQWVLAANSSLIDGRPFEEQFDHEQCSLGQWYYRYIETEAFKQLPEEKQRVYFDLEEPHRLFHHYGAEFAALIEKGPSARAEANDFFYNHVNPELEKTYQLLGEINRFKQERATQALLEAEEQESYGKMVTFIIAVLSLLLGSGLAFILANSIAKPVQETIQTIAVTSAQVAASMEQSERTAISQASSVAEVTSTMEELRVSSEQSTQQVIKVAENARDAAVAATEGLTSVEAMIRDMQDLRSKVDSIAHQILDLSEQISQIGTISSTVKDLADQTNMLALNAAVEAVRAGEHGKGFAVVSAEIRKLADLSKKASQQITTIVVDLQKATNRTVMVTEEGTKQVVATERLTNKNGDAFRELQRSMEEISQYIEQVSLNLEQQSGAIGGVSTVMEDITQGTKETAASIGETKEGMENLRKAGMMLKDTV
ncbi:methyl-accepting chemotaxis protein [Heliorestis convoluta]|uniref:Methyl-accepting chemotaxis (MCP) signaling domain protein n=1 Tax=Heliorestis convoluta TaxID=356322 RepID=A0A5Q2N1V1_9FIRM|nr:methyl-accepting chemotaxis protein [Heliorestis convoluta]QGG47813.1 methyl-accepting chemotaxis (MCP) signaling domain protein [Heliorestis convoluta]